MSKKEYKASGYCNSPDLPQLDGAVLCYSIKGAAAATGLSMSAIYRLMQTGELETFKLGRRTLIRREQIEQLLDRAEQGKLSRIEPHGEDTKKASRAA